MLFKPLNVLFMMLISSSSLADIYICSLTRHSKSGYDKEIEVSVKIENNQISNLNLTSTLIAPERGLEGSTCEFISPEGLISPIRFLKSKVKIDTESDSSSYALITTKTKNDIEIDTTKIDTKSCVPPGLWARKIVVSKGNENCRLTN